MIEELLGPTGADVLYVTICMLVCLAICTFCESLKSTLKEEKTEDMMLPTDVKKVAHERVTEPSDWAALSERKKMRSADKRLQSEKERKIA